MRADAGADPDLALDLGLKRVGARRSAIEGDGGHAHDQIVGRAGHDASHRFQHVASDQLGAGHERLVADRLRVGREDAAVMIGDADRPHHLEIRLDDGVGRGPEDAELASPAENVAHRRTIPVTCHVHRSFVARYRPTVSGFGVRWRPQCGPPVARRRVRRVHLSRAVSHRIDRLPVRGHPHRHRLRELHLGAARMAGAAASSRFMAGPGAGSRDVRSRRAALGQLLAALGPSPFEARHAAKLAQAAQAWLRRASASG